MKDKAGAMASLWSERSSDDEDLPEGVPNYWDRQRAVLDFLQGLEVRMGGVNGMNAVFHRLEAYPQIRKAFMRFLTATTLIVQYRGYTVEGAIDRTQLMIEKLFTPERLLMLQSELDMLQNYDAMNPEEKVKAKARFDSVMDQFELPNGDQLKMIAPAEVMEYLKSLGTVDVLSEKPVGKQGMAGGKPFVFNANPGIVH